MIIAVLREALERRILGLDPMEFQVEAEGNDYLTVRRGRQSPPRVQEVYSGKPLNGVHEAYEEALNVVLRQPE